MWPSEDVQGALVGTAFEQSALPAGVGTTSRSVERRGQAGAVGQAIEEIGVRGHRAAAMAKRDLSSDNEDLRAFCGELLASRSGTFLSGVPTDADTVQVTSKGLDRLDLIVDGRPFGSCELQDVTTEVKFPATWTSAVLAAYDELLRQRRRLQR